MTEWTQTLFTEGMALLGIPLWLCQRWQGQLWDVTLRVTRGRGLGGTLEQPPPPQPLFIRPALSGAAAPGGLRGQPGWSGGLNFCV